MSSTTVLLVLGGYFLVLIIISRLTGKNADTETFFTANRQSPWYLVAFGMIGASLSGVTFISVPGWVQDTQFGYMQVVMGYVVGYAVIALVLLPLYYRLKLVSIYTYLETRFGFWSYKTGAGFFILSRVIGASFRLFLVANVLQLILFEDWGVDFWQTVMITILLIWIYTFKGGIKTIVWTDTLQTLFMLVSVGVSIWLIKERLGFGLGELITTVQESDFSKVFYWEFKGANNFFKQFISGAFIAIVMTGLDQDMMQKNLTCRTLQDAQKNVFWFTIVLVFVNLMFLTLGALLYIYAAEFGITTPAKTDDLFPVLATQHFSLFAGIMFLLGITAAAYSSADSALTALTTSFCVDFLNFDKRQEDEKKRLRLTVHVGFSIVLFIVIMIFHVISDQSVISALFTAAGYTYGPLLGLYAFGLYTKTAVKDRWVPWVCLIAPILSYALNLGLDKMYDFKVGFFVLIINGCLTFIGMLLIRKEKHIENKNALDQISSPSSE